MMVSPFPIGNRNYIYKLTGTLLSRAALLSQVIARTRFTPAGDTGLEQRITLQARVQAVTVLSQVATGSRLRRSLAILPPGGTGRLMSFARETDINVTECMMISKYILWGVVTK